MNLDAERRVVSDRRGPPGEPRLSETARIEAAQFLLGTRQREEAALRATHLRGEHSPEDEEHARATLAEMIHLQEAITARSNEVNSDGAAALTRPGFLRASAWAFVLALVIAVCLVATWQIVTA